MKETYLSRDFRETAAQCFPAQAKELNTAFDMRLSALLAENAGASKEKQYHLKRQILPGIAAYETLQRVMPKEEALQTVHGYVERLARTSHKQLAMYEKNGQPLEVIIRQFVEVKFLRPKEPPGSPPQGPAQNRSGASAHRSGRAAL